MSKNFNNSFRNIKGYSKEFLQASSEGVLLHVTYKNVWDDGFGARGWKIDASIGDPEIIASTRETGQKINTSVFIHDILDHFLSGFWISGHRSEAMALIQLSKRTNSDPEPDYVQMVKEDIINGRVNGETLIAFLPGKLKELLPSDSEMSNKAIISFLKHKVGEKNLQDILVEQFFTLGKAGEEHAISSWLALGLDPEKQTAIGLALQKLLDVIDTKVEEMKIEELKGIIVINNENVTFTMRESNCLDSINGYQTCVS